MIRKSFGEAAVGNIGRIGPSVREFGRHGKTGRKRGETSILRTLGK